MINYKKNLLILSIGVVFYFFIEAFYTMLVNTNAFVFMNLSDLLKIGPPILIILVLLIIEFFLIFSKRFRRSYKLYILLYIIIALRLITQFIIAPSVLLICNFIMVFSCLLFFMGLIWLKEVRNIFDMDNREFFAAVFIGLAIHYIFLIVDISSSLTYNSSKILSTIAFSIIIGLINNYLFLPKKVNINLTDEEGKNIDSSKKEVTIIHFIILGAIFIYSTMLLFNPMALAAYDVINLNYNNIISIPFLLWPSYGFTYYIFLILITSIISYFITDYVLRRVEIHALKYTIIILFIISGVLTLAAMILIEQDQTLTSTIYLSLLTVIQIFSVIFYLRYLFLSYSFRNARKLLTGIVIFFITSFIFIILHIEVLWYGYVSLLLDSVIQIGIAAVLIIFLELRAVDISFRTNLKPFNQLKEYGIISLILLIISGGFFTFVIQSHTFPTYSEESPKILLWNIHNAIGVDDLFDLDRLAQDIITQDPDIIGLNEVDTRLLKTASIDIASYLAHKLNMYYVYGPTLYKHYGNLILSKYPITFAQIIQLPTIASDGQPRSLIKTKILVNSSTWTIYNTHLSTDSEDRLVQVPFIIGEIDKEPSFERTVWMGDLNLEPSSIEYDLINSSLPLNFTDTFRFLNSDPGYTGDFDDNLQPQKRIDYILCSPDLIPITSSVYCSIGSDHCAVITQF